MAICKHNTAKNGFAAAVEYLTMQHDAKGALLRDGDGLPLPGGNTLSAGSTVFRKPSHPCACRTASNLAKKWIRRLWIPTSISFPSPPPTEKKD